MNELFTFNSQQFQAIHQQQGPIFRKRIIKTGEGKREISPVTSPSTCSDNHASD
jgi:hypothetical protein